MGAIYVPLKNGFGDQLLSIIFGLNAMETTGKPLYIVTDIQYKNPIYKYNYTSYLSDYIHIDNATFIKVQDLPTPLNTINDSQDRRRDLFQQVLIDDKYLLLGNERYYNNIQLYNLGIFTNFTNVQKLLILKKYCKFTNLNMIRKNYEDFIRFYFNISESIGVQIRFRDMHYSLRNQSIKHTLDKLSKIRNSYIFLTYDNELVFKKLRISSLIHNSNNVHSYGPIDALVQKEDIDYSDRAKHLDEFCLFQYYSLCLAYKLAKCKSFIGTNDSNFSNFVIPLMKYSI